MEEGSNHVNQRSYATRLSTGACSHVGSFYIP
nr:MAG TPA: hypothetical protein [Podoviridae sp. ctbMi3]